MDICDGIEGKRRIGVVVILDFEGGADLFDFVCLCGLCGLFGFGWDLRFRCDMVLLMFCFGRMGGNLGGGMIIEVGRGSCGIGGDCGGWSHGFVVERGLGRGSRKDRREVAWAVISLLNILSLDCWATLNSSNQARIKALGNFLRVERGCSRRCLS